jgi:hypothetical protein
MTEEEMEDLAEKIAKKVFKMEELKRDKEKEKSMRSKVFEEGSEFLICKSCSSYKDSADLPPQLKRSCKAGLGFIAKYKEAGGKRNKYKIRQVMKEHCESNIHKWCEKKETEVKEVSKSYEQENKEVGLLVITAFLKTALEGGSSADFIKEINFLHLIPGVKKSQKNNSRYRFFILRDDCFEVMNGIVKNLFQSDQVTELSVTLDKVTVQHRSFTVLLTFFFHNGRIHCILNSLLKMNLEDYDAAGTAHMVVTNLQETLCLTRTELARKLLHFRCGYVSIYLVIYVTN